RTGKRALGEQMSVARKCAKLPSAPGPSIGYDEAERARMRDLLNVHGVRKITIRMRIARERIGQVEVKVISAVAGHQRGRMVRREAEGFKNVCVSVEYQTNSRRVVTLSVGCEHHGE